MHILLTNDDGIFAPGLAATYKHLTRIAEVSVVAPAQPQSGASHSISLTPLTCDRVDITGRFSGYSVEGSPVDCVKLAVTKLIAKPIDLVVSGINHGANTGVHVHYSGTVGAAMEGAFCGIPAIALSAAFEPDLDLEKAADYGVRIIEQLLPLKSPAVINVNIPMLSKGEPKGVKVVPHSVNSYEEDYIQSDDENGQTTYQYTSGKHRDKTTTDTTAVLEGYITLTALHFDMTDIEENKKLEKMSFDLT